MLRKSLCLVLAVGLLLPVLAAAEEGPVIWLSFLKAKPGQSDALTKALVKQNSPLYDKLVSEGAIHHWGIAQPINHVPGQAYSHVEFVAFANWQGVGDFVNGFVAGMMAKSEEQRQADQETYRSAVVEGSHFDLVNRGVHIGGTSAGPPRYFNVGMLKAQPGTDLKKLYEDFAVPVFEKVSADGKIGHFGLEVQELHGDHSWTHIVWYELPDLGARDAIETAFAAAEAARTDEENAAMGKRFAETLVPDTHRDEIALVVHYSDGAGGGAEE